MTEEVIDKEAPRHICYRLMIRTFTFYTTPDDGGGAKTLMCHTEVKHMSGLSTSINLALIHERKGKQKKNFASIYNLVPHI